MKFVSKFLSRWFVFRKEYDTHTKQYIKDLDVAINARVDEAMLYMCSYGEPLGFSSDEPNIRDLRGIMRKKIRSEVAQYDATVQEKIMASINENLNDNDFVDRVVKMINNKQLTKE